MKARICLKNAALGHYLSSYEMCQRSGEGKLKKILQKSIQQYKAPFFSVTATIFTATIFLGGAYFFFVQLAEHGW